MKKVDFEDYLMEKHAEQYIGISDDAVDDFNDWITDLDPQELIDYGQAYAKKAYNAGMKHICKEVEKILNIKY